MLFWADWLHRYAHQALKIVNVAQVNEDPNLRLIRELRAEIDALRSKFGTPAVSPAQRKE